MKLLLFGPAVFILVHCQLCSGQTPLEIIERYIDTVSNGDIKNWYKIKSVILESEVFYGQDEYDKSGPIFSRPKGSYHKQFRVFPDKLKAEIYADSTCDELLSSWWYLSDRTIMQFQNMAPITTAQPNQKDQLWNFKPVEIQQLVKESKAIRYKGVKDFELEGVSCFYIEVEKKDGTLIDLYFNTRSYLLQFTKKSNESEPLTYGAFTDYKVIDGLLFHTATHSMKNGRIFFGSKTKQIHINYPIDNDKFKPD